MSKANWFLKSVGLSINAVSSGKWKKVKSRKRKVFPAKNTWNGAPSKDVHPKRPWLKLAKDWAYEKDPFLTGLRFAKQAWSAGFLNA